MVKKIPGLQGTVPFPTFRMYDVDGNGHIDQEEMTNVVQAIYVMVRKSIVSKDTADVIVQNIFSIIDENSDGQLTEHEFVMGCKHNDTLSKLLVPNMF